MGVAGEISLDSEPLQLHQNIQVFGGSSHISHRTFKHKDNHNLKTSLSHTPQFYFLLVWQTGGLTYDIREVVSFSHQIRSRVGHNLQQGWRVPNNRFCPN